MTGPDSIRRAVDPGRRRWYGPELEGMGFRLLGLLDREPDSRTFGCFDRDHWAWKFRDHPLAMAQSAVYPLALLWRFPVADEALHGSTRVVEWLHGAFAYTLDRQHANGAFDLVAPNEQDPGSTLGVMHALSEAFLLLEDARPAGLEDRFRDGLRRACEFALRHEEEHAFISNHWALFAMTYLNAAAVLAERRYAAHAAELVERIVARQSPDGWYHEYGGPDPGYESLGLLHLATYWRRTRDPEVLRSLRRAVEFFAHCVHPDGSVGGAYGSRRTALYFPAGFEILAEVDGQAAGVARFLRARLGRQNVVTPKLVDAENLPQVVYAYVEACLVPSSRGETDAETPPPCESLRGMRAFEDAGLVSVGREAYYAVASARRGGVLRAFARAGERLAYEDVGYVARAGKQVWASRTGRCDRWVVAEDTLTTAVAFGEVRQELLTPLRLLVLRLLNLTLFRSPALGGWLRRMIVRRLMERERAGPCRLQRRVTFAEDAIRVTDRITASPRPRELQIAPRRTFTGVHMGSARYFHPSELDDAGVLETPGIDTMQARAGAVVRRFVVRIGTGTGTATVVSEAAVPEVEEVLS